MPGICGMVLAGMQKVVAMQARLWAGMWRAGRISKPLDLQGF